MTYLERFLEAIGVAWCWRKFEALMVWLGRFAWDKEKNEPSYRRGIALMCATALCVGFLWLAAWSPFKDALQDVIIDYAWVLAAAGGLGVAGTVLPAIFGRKAGKDPQDGQP